MVGSNLIKLCKNSYEEGNIVDLEQVCSFVTCHSFCTVGSIIKLIEDSMNWLDVMYNSFRMCSACSLCIPK